MKLKANPLPWELYNFPSWRRERYMTDLAYIRQHWEAHQRRPFPLALAGEEVDGEDVLLLALAAAGCISTFLASRGIPSLDPRRLDVLAGCAQSLGRIFSSSQMSDEQRDYFSALRLISECVVGFCRDYSNDDDAANPYGATEEMAKAEVRGRMTKVRGQI